MFSYNKWTEWWLGHVECRHSGGENAGEEFPEIPFWLTENNNTRESSRFMFVPQAPQVVKARHMNATGSDSRKDFVVQGASQRLGCEGGGIGGKVSYCWRNIINFVAKGDGDP